MNITIRVVACCVWVLAARVPAPAAWTWERVDYPGSDWTYANGVSGNEVVGAYGGDGGIHGFTYDGQTWGRLDYPGSYITYANGVWQNEVVGYYTMPGWSGYEAGFLYDGHTWKTLAYPGATQTRAEGVYGNRVVGYYTGSDSRDHGFVYDGVHWTTLDYPNTWDPWTYAWGIDGDTIVGAYWGTLARGFTYDGKTWTSSLPPGAYASSLRGISGDTLIGGLSTADQPQVSRSFVLTGSTLTYVDCPWGYDRTLVSGISGNCIVGTYRETHGGQDYSFLLTMPEPTSLSLLALAALPTLARKRRVAPR